VISSTPDLRDHWIEEGDKGSEEDKGDTDQAQIYFVLSGCLCTDKICEKELIYEMEKYCYICG
jgi:hypothetical protein